ncbi:MAG: CHAT domain-containing protein [Scytonema sp. PMC 1069.18]|nr:CHAT domain-containing protein [Scytonema sp. PMC 1069.18]MEC4880182.1 CHAT domain-containing protein [Scytonema sp. PMC 1070.18]
MKLKRHQAYQSLIQMLLSCSSPEETSLILNNNKELCDAGLVDLIEQTAEELSQRRDQDSAKAAAFLKNLARLLAEELGLSQPSHPLTFLSLLFREIEKSNGDWQVVSLLMEANQEKLNDNFAEWLDTYAYIMLSQAKPEQVQNVARHIWLFCDLIKKFPFANQSNKVKIIITGYEICAKVLTYEFYPQDWAGIQNNLGLTYLEQQVWGKIAENVEIAINCFNNSLKVYSCQTDPKMWTSIQYNLGIAYAQRIRGNQAENLEIAIGCFNAALKIHVREASPKNWANIKTNLGIAYKDRIQGEKAENLEAAISCYKDALEVFTCENSPEEWARIHTNLGVVYNYRIMGETAENLENAITCFHKALKVYTRQNFPETWADIHQNLCHAYLKRTREERKDNLEAAINYISAALEVYTSQNILKKCASAQVNLGVAYRERIQGQRADNLETAIDCFKDALKIYTKQNFPSDWANTQNNLGEAYYHRNWGSKEENLEAAIDFFNAALEIYTDKGFPSDWANTKNNLGNAYHARIRGEKLENLEQAIRAYKLALSIRTREAFPQNHAQTLFNLGLAYQDARQFHNTYNAFAAAIDTVESERGEILLGSGIEEDKRKLAEQWNYLYQSMVKVCLELAQAEPQYYAQAIEYVERSKARNLVELVAAKNLYPKSDLFPNLSDYDNMCRKLDYLRQEIPTIQRQIESAKSLKSQETSRNTLEYWQQQLKNLQQQREHLLKKINQVDPDFKLTQQVQPITFKEIQALIDEDTAIIEWFVVSKNQILSFIITHYSPHPTVLQSTPEDWKALTELDFVQYLNKYQTYSWYGNRQQQLSKLAEILHIGEVLAQLPQGCNQLILIPCLWLHLLPLHALPLPKEPDKCLLDKFERGVRYAPSCQLLQLNQKRQKSDLRSLFALQDPSSNLKYANLEVETVKSMFGSAQVLVQQQATETAVKTNQNLQSSHCLHFACHGEFNLKSPLESALLLAKEEGSSEDGRLTLAEIFGLNLTHNRLVTLSACETGLTDPNSTSDEYISLPSGFLYAGSSSVVSSLWTVNDLSTAILMIKFYENLHQGLSLAVALNQAQLWLRDATKNQLKNWIEQHQLTLTLRKAIPIIDKQPLSVDSERPFHDPFYWAAFCAVGN